MRCIFGSIIILLAIHKLRAYHNCPSYYVLLEDSIFGDEIVADPALVDTAVFESLNSSIPRECYIGFNCLGSSSECSQILSKTIRYGPDTRLTEPITEKTTSTTSTPSPHGDDDEKAEAIAICLNDLKHYIVSENCEEKNDTKYKTSAFYQCNTLPCEYCGSSMPGGYIPSYFTREHGRNCKSFITHISKLYYKSSDFMPYPYPILPADFDAVPCIDFTTTCILDLNCTNEGKIRANIYRYEPSEKKNNSKCSSATEIFASNDTAVEIEVSKDLNYTTPTKASTTTTSTKTTEATTSSTSATTTMTSTSTASTIATIFLTVSTNATTAKTPTSIASTIETEVPTDSTNATTETLIYSINATTTESAKATETSLKTSTHSTNATTPGFYTSTTPTTATDTPRAINETDKTNMRNVDLTNSEFYTNESFKGYVYNFLGNTSEKNFIIYIVLICIALFVCGMLTCLALMTCVRCSKKRKYAVEGREACDSLNAEETIPMDLINIIGTAEPTDEYFLRNSSNKLRASSRSCPERKSYIKSEVY